MIYNGEVLEAFAGTFLSPRYDEARPTPEFHREVWADYTSDHPQVAIAAPRDHAKSTAFAVDFVLGEVLFRRSDYVILIGSTEELSQEQLSNVSEELHENDDLRQEFGLLKFEVDQKTEIIVKMDDGHRFRILARGAEQRIRGRMWKGKRPNLLVGDDMEDDEQVESRERRTKFRRWFFRAAKQALSRSGRIRVHGTILHEDSLLARLVKNPEWKSRVYKAHASYNDFSGLLWPARWPKEDLRAKQRELEAENDAAGYSQEYLNDPQDTNEAFIRRDDLLPMQPADYESGKIICAAADFAISKLDSADHTSFTIGGKDVQNILHIVDQRSGRWGALEIIEEIFAIQTAYHPAVFWVEDDTIWKTVSPMIYKEMQVRDIWVNLTPVRSTKDKAARGRSFQKLSRARGMRFDKSASWWPLYESVVLRFTPGARALRDDEFDSTALLCRGFDTMSQIEHEDMLDDAELEEEYQSARMRGGGHEGRSAVTGY